MVQYEIKKFMSKSLIVFIVLVIAVAIAFFLPARMIQKPINDSSPEDIIQTPGEKTQKAVIKTNKGDIELKLYTSDAPKTVENFIKKSKEGFYNNLVFHRVEDWVIQGGDPKGDGTGGGEMPTELSKLPFKIGSLGVARGENINVSNDSQFFITKKAASWLDGQYTNFGEVAKGMDVVEKIAIGDKIINILIE